MASRAYSIPNLLTYARIVAVPLIVLCFFIEGRLESSDFARWTALDPAPNAVDAALMSVGRQCAELLRDGLIDPIRYSVLELRLTEMSHVLAGCERIKTTPLPFAYALLLHRTAHAFCLMLERELRHAQGQTDLPPVWPVHRDRLS